MELPQPDFDVINNALGYVAPVLEEIRKLKNLPIVQNAETIARLSDNVQALTQTMSANHQALLANATDAARVAEQQAQADANTVNITALTASINGKCCVSLYRPIAAYRSLAQ
jgi:hypothetical protein